MKFSFSRILKSKNPSTHIETRDYKGIKKIKFWDILSITFILCGLFGTGFFIYSDVYLTISNLDPEIAAQISPRIETINFTLYNKTVTDFTDKNNQDYITLTKNIFSDSLDEPEEILEEPLSEERILNSDGTLNEQLSL